MNTFKSFKSQLYKVNEDSFEDIALRLFQYQAEHNALYRTYIKTLGIQADKIHSLNDIPFLPVSFFKHHPVMTGDWQPETTFYSSGTTSSISSSHHIQNLDFYHQHSVRCFEHFFGSLSDFHFLALLPSYLENKNSSLVAMIRNFIQKSGSALSGFYLDDTSNLLFNLEKLKKDEKKTILWGVTFALLDLAELYGPDLSHCIILETGGMKGRREEMTRQEFHAILRKKFNISMIHSEYGMTELLSQSYTKGTERFYCPPWMRITGRDLSDPLQKGLLNETAGINVVDIANWHSIGFIETEDMGKVFADHSFEILGRMDNSEVRGCNLMVE